RKMTVHQILVVDVGNTRAKFGVFDVGSASAPQPRTITAIELAAVPDFTEAVFDWIAGPNIEVPQRVILAGSNPPYLDQLLADPSWGHITPTVVRTAADIPINTDVDEPENVGVDRLLTAFAAAQLFAPAQAAIVVDSGTATTIDLVTADGVFRGGSILPGLRLSAYALHDYTARLPMIDTDRFGLPTDDSLPLPGRNTRAAINAGLFWGQLGAIKEITGRLQAAALSQFGCRETPIRIITGGGGRKIATHLTDSVFVDSLALHGLAVLATNT
ncbi:MAG: type III pantothenate kinase, partial [Fuerstiella sp.]